MASAYARSSASRFAPGSAEWRFATAAINAFSTGRAFPAVACARWIAASARVSRSASVGLL